MKTLSLVLALLPAPALADYACTLVQQCGGGACEDFTGGPATLRELGDSWQLEIGGQIWEGFGTASADTGGELSVVFPPQNGASGLASLFPSGDVLMTFHAFAESPVAITGTGTCTEEEG